MPFSRLSLLPPSLLWIVSDLSLISYHLIPCLLLSEVVRPPSRSQKEQSSNEKEQWSPKLNRPGNSLRHRRTRPFDPLPRPPHQTIPSYTCTRSPRTLHLYLDEVSRRSEQKSATPTFGRCPRAYPSLLKTSHDAVFNALQTGVKNLHIDLVRLGSEGGGWAWGRGRGRFADRWDRWWGVGSR